MRKLLISSSLHYKKCMIRQVTHLTLYIHVAQRDKIIGLTRLRALYVEIDTQVEKALGLIFMRSTTVIPRLTKIIRSGITFVSRNLR